MISELLRLVVVDGETVARERFRRLLQSENDIELIAEAVDGEEAVRVVAETKPDILVLEVTLPRLDGFGVLERLGSEVPSAVVFTTALREHAARAYDAKAVDYLLKPFSPERLRQALNQVRQRCVPNSSNGLAARPSGGEITVARIALRSQRRNIIVPLSSIRYVLADDANCKVFGQDGVIKVTESLRDLQLRLPSQRFLRISRFAVVNLDQVEAIEPKSHGDQIIVLSDRTRLAVARTHRRALLDKLALSSRASRSAESNRNKRSEMPSQLISASTNA